MRAWVEQRSSKIPVSLAAAKQYARVPSGGVDDSLIYIMIRAATIKAERAVGLSIVPVRRMVLARAVQRKPNVYGPDSLYDRDHIGPMFELPYGPLQGVEAVDYIAADNTVTAIDAYEASPEAGTIAWTDGVPESTEQGFVRVQYYAGFAMDDALIPGGSTTPAEQETPEVMTGVPDGIQMAILLMVSDLYECRGDEAGPIPPRAMQYLNEYKRVRVAG